ncbi:MAG: 16S rRNA (cytidine(1402)-2'-O)-methyltransferase [Bacteroidetes bacterium]|nr:16S rRNA (cytidine(1402)-2'-O)-methyltransferase [Bacteroidota bacterium]
MPLTPSLFIVPTPIGNLGDITLRALEVLKKVDLVLAEDTRKSGLLLKHFGISQSMQSFHNFNEHRKVAQLIEKMHKGEKMALISDAGTPGISDPGFLLVRECLKNDIPIECLPGPTAFIPALVKSGFSLDRFVFEGFLPHKKGRLSRLQKLNQDERTMVFYESPHRLIKTLKQLAEHLGPERRASVSRELTKIHEQTITSCLKDIITYYSEHKVRGEFVIVVEGKKTK